MTREEFTKMEELCKRGWRSLARTGERKKPRYLARFICNCPACEVSKVRSQGEREGNFRCTRCPVTVWRRIAQKDKKNNTKTGCGVCAKPGMPFANWADSSPYCRRRRQAAAVIVDLEWSWLKVYEKVKL